MKVSVSLASRASLRTCRAFRGFHQYSSFGFRCGLLVPVLLLLGLATPSLPALTLLSSNQLVFLNVDHAPMGACSTMTYGYHGEPCGVGTSSGVCPYCDSWGGGVLIAVSNSSGMQLMPFVTNLVTIARFPYTSIQRQLTPGTDEYTITGVGLSYTHFSPAWLMTDIGTATLSEKKRCFLPATWLAFTINNTNNTPEDLYFGLPVPVTQRTFANSAYQGFSLGE